MGYRCWPMITKHSNPCGPNPAESYIEKREVAGQRASGLVPDCVRRLSMRDLPALTSAGGPTNGEITASARLSLHRADDGKSQLVATNADGPQLGGTLLEKFLLALLVANSIPMKSCKSAASNMACFKMGLLGKSV